MNNLLSLKYDKSLPMNHFSQFLLLQLDLRRRSSFRGMRVCTCETLSWRLKFEFRGNDEAQTTSSSHQAWHLITNNLQITHSELRPRVFRPNGIYPSPARQCAAVRSVRRGKHRPKRLRPRIHSPPAVEDNSKHNNEPPSGAPFLISRFFHPRLFGTWVLRAAARL